jgi:hypothetical protein
MLLIKIINQMLIVCVSLKKMLRAITWIMLCLRELGRKRVMIGCGLWLAV